MFWLKVVLLLTVRKQRASRKNILRKLLKSSSLILGSHPYFSHRSQAARMTVLASQPACTSSPGLYKEASSLVESAEVGKMMHHIGRRDMLTKRWYAVCKGGYSWLQNKNKRQLTHSSSLEDTRNLPRIELVRCCISEISDCPNITEKRTVENICIWASPTWGSLIAYKCWRANRL